jgi:site-specific recombinase XerC
MEGADLYAVGQILGHKTPRMTQRYSHLSPDYMAAAVSKIDSAFAKSAGTPTGLRTLQTGTNEN